MENKPDNGDDKKDLKPKKLNKGIINTLANLVQNNMNKLYRNTYYTEPQNKLDLDTIKNDINDSISKLISHNVDNTGLSTLSSLYTKLQMSKQQNGQVDAKKMDDLLNDKNVADRMISSSLENNKFIKDYDDEIDLILKYMDQLKDALDAKKDSVLSSDHFSKDFINIISKSSTKTDEGFNDKIKKLKDKYKLIEFFDDLYDKTSKYGDQFVYCVPYNKALSRLLKNKTTQMTNGNYTISESNIENIIENSSINFKVSVKNNNISIISEGVDYKQNIKNQNVSDKAINGGFNVELNKSCVLESAILEYTKMKKIKKQQIQGNFMPNDLHTIEGLHGQESIINNNTTDKGDPDKIDVPGCVLQTLDREKVIPIYMNNMCMGYYCLEYDGDDFFNGRNMKLDPLGTFTKSAKMAMEYEQDNQKDNILRNISNQLVSYIDANFINSNQDLAKQIYMILKYNDFVNGRDGEANNLKVTFIPPEDMFHIYFEKDPKTNRGISDLENSLLPAKLYTELYVTDTVAHMTRGFDKRVYYVKQNVDTNVSQVLLNVINQIKKGNFGSRELTNIKSILGITGRYNDLLIPMNSSGEAPIQFEIMQGQDIQIKTELLDMLEQMAVNGTGVPYEYVQSRKSVDYAVRLTMASGKFLRGCYKRQAIVEKYHMSPILTVIYNAEYNENETIEAKLPPPTFLNVVNTAQVLQNVNQLVEDIVQSEGDPENQTFNMRLTKNLKRHYLGTFIDYDDIDRIKRQTQLELKVEEKQSQQQQ